MRESTLGKFKIQGLTFDICNGIPEISYIEHSTDDWASDTTTVVDLTKEDAEKIIVFLKLSFPDLQ